MNSRACSEVYSILSIMDKNNVKRIPQKLLEFIKTNRDIFYNPEFKELPENFNNLEHDTQVIFAMIYKKYFKEIDNLKIVKTTIVSKEFENYEIKEDVAIVKYKENIYIKIKNWITNIKKMLFR